MQKTFALFLALAVVLGVAPYARSLGTPSAPAGVAAADWVPLGDAAGIVIRHDRDSRVSGAERDKPGTVQGYFMVRRAGAWLRVDATPPFDVQKTLMGQ